ncbi:hypothetical protein Leryth_025444 [Lithospermum erythrorhizon]|nr:hypothetical protein Leryth_025444 [Lithospermum erythrorhizon]
MRMFSFMANSPNLWIKQLVTQKRKRNSRAYDLNSILASPCEWFICDDDQNATRYFAVINLYRLGPLPSCPINLTHRDIVPRAFSAIIPNHVAKISKS